MAGAPLLLEVEELRTHFHYRDFGTVKAVDGVSFAIRRGMTMGLVGESGCGKSVTALSVLRLVPEPPARVTGRVTLHAADGPANLTDLKRNGRAIRRIRGGEIAMIFQEPMTSLNPVHSIGDQIAESIMLHRGTTRAEAREQAVALLDTVGIDRPRARAGGYAHQLSGGMRQRALIAMAISCDPALLIADEPTTALDVTIQAQILELLQRLQRERTMAIIMITHDLGVISAICDHVAVMYLGKIAEYGTTGDVLEDPRHPYTRGLLASIPVWQVLGKRGGRRRRIQPIPGVVPDPYSAPAGCPFRERCAEAWERCGELPPLFEPHAGHLARCWLEDPAGRQPAVELPPRPAGVG